MKPDLKLMCSLADCEMLVSHSPPVFSHSPPTSFLADYPSFRFPTDNFSRLPQKTCRASTPPNSLCFAKKRPEARNMPASPIRPCLVIRADDSLSSSDEDPTSPTRLKKKVVFADDKGIPLTQVRFMTEPSNQPPLWSMRFLAEVTNGITTDKETEDECWEITFPQPASDYVEFRKKLETNKVSLENVIVKESEDTIVGTIKVSNLAFHKEVIVRASSDKWKTYEDAFCNYVPQSLPSASSSAYVLYDTFSFKLTIPPKAARIEFCVCFRCESTEYWDSNGEKNYVIVKKVQPVLQKCPSADDIYNRQKNEAQVRKVLKQTYNDAADAKLDSWSEFASWTHLENSNPYW